MANELGSFPKEQHSSRAVSSDRDVRFFADSLGEKQNHLTAAHQPVIKSGETGETQEALQLQGTHSLLASILDVGKSSP
jgi:hypothetical protein